MDVMLVMFKSNGTRRDFPLSKPRVIIGRKNSCDLRIPLHSVSRQHCELILENDRLRLRDLGSSNGTYHNSNRVQEAELAAGDELVIGPVVFTVVIDGEPAQINPVRTILTDSKDTGVIRSPGDSAVSPGGDAGDSPAADLVEDVGLSPVAEPASGEEDDDESPQTLMGVGADEDENEQDQEDEEDEDTSPSLLSPAPEQEEQEQDADDDDKLSDRSDEHGALDLDDPLAALEALDDDSSEGSSLGEFEFLADDEDEK